MAAMMVVVALSVAGAAIGQRYAESRGG